MEPYSRIFRPELLGFKNYATGLKPEDVTSYCPFTGLTFMTRPDAYDNYIPDQTSIIVKIHGAFSHSPSPSSTPSSSSISASAPASASASASASTSFTPWSTAESTSIPSQTGIQSTYPATLGPSGASTAFGLFYGWNSPRNSVGIVPQVLYEQSKPHVDLFTAGMVLMNLLQTVNFANPLNGVGIRNVVLVTDSNYLFSCLTEHVYAWQSKGFRNAKGREVSNANAVKWVEGLIEEFERHDICVRFWKVDKKDNWEAVDLARRFLDLHNQFWRRHGIRALLNIRAA